MSVKKTLSLTRLETKKTAMAPMKVKKTRSLTGSSETSDSSHGSKKPRKDSKQCFSFMREITIEPEGARSLAKVDSGKLKAEIVRWAKRVVLYARQVSGRIGRSMTMSSRTGSSNESRP
ncbi:hypothetical protein CDL15_Pgr005012 [Punica granatum]|uniref:Uncharacterized protein n=1 Tax=Punica granatum TaxID=22663 RepID=A0A218XRG9_PUNGR|nr:hypothetical protein CDL15_Pgr005012 [Punica granatum]PKI43540.1 hypothetical protein CRG98_036075 [Punica granatum]